MEFKEKQAIYIQIGEYILEQILLKKIPIEGKLPSIRDLAVALEVNPNTVQRTYDFLQQKEIIYTKRGLGYFVSYAADQKIIEFRKEHFLEFELPTVFRNMHLLGVTIDDFKNKYLAYLGDNF
jgi:GntR family transcriptional regulator